MAQRQINSIQDGPRLTVSAIVKNPTLIQARMRSMLANQFIIDSLLRTLPPTQSGAYIYEEGTPLFADGEAEIVEEFGEIPTISGSIGERKVALTIKRALAVLVSQEMVNRNSIDKVNTQLRQVRNTMIRTWDNAFFNALLNHPDVPTMAAAGPWDTASAKIRTDLAEARGVIEDATFAGQAENYYDFNPDTLVIGKSTRTDLIQSDDFMKAYSDKLVDQSPAYTGTLPGTFVGLNILVSRTMDRLAPGKALLLERRTVGGIGDERALRTTPLYEDRPRETWRADTVRQSAIVIDQPKAAVWITGVAS